MKNLFLILTVLFSIVILCSCEEESVIVIDSEVSLINPKSLSKSFNYNASEEQNGWGIADQMDLGDKYGYKLYLKGDSYLQKVNLKLGSKLTFSFGDEKINSQYRESPLFQRKSGMSFWLNQPPKTISMVNASFFDINKMDYTTLSFPIKEDGFTYSVGSDNIRYDKRKLVLFEESAYISSFSVMENSPVLVKNNLAREQTVICGYAPNADLSSSILGDLRDWWGLERTFIGLKDQDNDVYHEKEVLYILSGCYSQKEATETLVNLGCNETDIIMLDGSKSAQMIAHNPDKNWIIYTFNVGKRTIPNVLFVTHK